ncbi:hypothetical protein [Naasia sp. SYSU D00057]|uniref:hypothetical protein n=1 Tax=Naasia sp. SYSU D00057 TaxID=2817380 RepID=UPI001B317669|nr:hypothetical protein [Naasia sp. SYSU D00057]
MAFLPIPPADDLTDEARSARAQLLESRGRVSNVRAALLGHVPSFRAYLEWYTLKDELVPVIGELGVAFLSHAISAENADTACALFFRRVLEEAGEDPEEPRTERDALLVEFGRQLARSPHGLPDELYERVAAAFSAPQRVQLVAFGGLVVAINVVNTVGRVPVDEELHPFRDTEPELAMDSLESGAE